MRRLCRVLLIFILLHLACYLCVSLIVPYEQQLDNGQIQFKDVDARWYDHPKNIVWGREGLRGASNNVFVLGVSTSRAFRPAWIEEELGGNYTVHSVFIPGGNITVQRGIIDLLRDVGAGAQSTDVFVLPVCYTAFRPNHLSPYGETDFIKAETGGLSGWRLRLYGLWRGYLLKLRHLAYYCTYYQVKLHALGGAEGIRQEINRRLDAWNRLIVPESKRQKILRSYRAIYNGADIGEEQFVLLDQLVEGFRGRRETLVLLNMPIAPWFQKRSKYPGYYAEKIAPIVTHAKKLSNVHWLDYAGMLNDEDFIDSLHIKPREYEKLSRMLGRDLARKLRE